MQKLFNHPVSSSSQDTDANDCMFLCQ